MPVFGGGATIHSRPAHMRIRRLFEAPVPLLTELRLLMWVGCAHMRIRRLFEAPVPLLTELRLLMWVG